MKPRKAFIPVLMLLAPSCFFLDNLAGVCISAAVYVISFGWLLEFFKEKNWESNLYCIAGIVLNAWFFILILISFFAFIQLSVDQIYLITFVCTVLHTIALGSLGFLENNRKILT
jgi:hypothetical protein